MNRHPNRSKAYITSRRGSYGVQVNKKVLQDVRHPVEEKDALSSPRPTKKRSTSKALPFKGRQSRSNVLSRSAISKRKIKRKVTVRAVANHALVGLFVVTNLALGGYFIADNFYGFNTNGNSLVSSVAGSSPVLGDSTTPQIEATNFPIAVTEKRSNSFSAVQIRGIDTGGNLLYPDDGSYIAWYERSAKPGITQNSASLLFASLDDKNNSNNSFAIASKDLNKGDVIDLTLGGGDVLRFKVIKKDTAETKDVKVEPLLKSESASSPGLTILINTNDGTNNMSTILFCVQV